MISQADINFMQIALNLAKRGIYSTSPNPRVGCVLVNSQQQILAQAWHHFAGQLHAEANALADLQQKNISPETQNITAYITLEPCSHYGKTPPCADALIAAKIKRAVIAIVDNNPNVAGKGIAKLKAANIEVDIFPQNFDDQIYQQAYELNRGFFQRMQKNMAFIRSKIAASLDGRTALQNGESKWISNEKSRLDVQKIRAESCAILTGIGTILADNPTMNVRNIEQNFNTLEVKQPLQIIFDSNFRIPLNSNILQKNQKVIIVGNEISQNSQNSQNSKNKNIEALQNLQNVDLIFKKNNQNLVEILQILTEKYQLNNILLEAGQTLNGSFLQQNLIDEMIIYFAAKFLGNNSRGMFSQNTFLSPSLQQENFYFHSSDLLDNNLKIVLRKK